jgi:hypothetical protein
MRQSELVHHTRTQHLLHGCACSRQTTLLAHGIQARSGVGAAPMPSLALPLAERLPESDMQLTHPCGLQRGRASR